MSAGSAGVGLATVQAAMAVPVLAAYVTTQVIPFVMGVMFSVHGGYNPNSNYTPPNGVSKLQNASNSHTLHEGTAKQFNRLSGKNYASREWGKMLENLKGQSDLGANDHCSIYSNGDVVHKGTYLGNLIDEMIFLR